MNAVIASSHNDRRGHGRSDQTCDGNDTDTYADDLAEFLETLDRRHVIVIGHSIGGGEVARCNGRPRHPTSGIGRAAGCVMRVSSAEYLKLKLRVHEFLHDVPLYDVSVVDLPGGAAGRSVADIRALDSAAAPSHVANGLYGVRHFLGRVFGWDRAQLRPEESLLSRLSDRDRLDSEIAPGTRVGPFLLLYQFPQEALIETRNATVHGFVCTALARTTSGYRLYWGVYVLPVSLLTRPYLIAIEPFRRFILYPAMLRRIRRAWLAAYGASA